MAFNRPLTPQQSSSQLSGLRTPPDQEMTDQPQPSPRPALPSSSADFALANPSAPASPTNGFMALDEPSPQASPSTAWNYAYNYQSNTGSSYPLLRKLRRPSLLGLGPIGGGFNPGGFGASSSRMNSPLVSSFTSPFAFEAPRQPSSRPQEPVEEEEEPYTPVLLSYEPAESSSSRPSESERSSSPRKHRHRISRSMSPSTPPQRHLELDPGNAPKDATARRTTSLSLRRSSSSTSLSESPATSKAQPIPSTSSSRRFTLPRLRNIITESNPSENEVKSEAKFQRFVASHAEIPAPFRSYPRTPRSRAGSSNGIRIVPEKGRFPEEASVEDEEIDEDDTGSSDGMDPPTEDPGSNGGMSLTEDSFLSMSIPGMSIPGSLGAHRG